MKQQLSEALVEFTYLARGNSLVGENFASVLVAARLVERLLPGECPEKDCDNGILKIGSPKNWTTHASCHGSGQVWDEGIVEAVATAIGKHAGWNFVSVPPADPLMAEARAVLSALVELLTEKAGSQ